MLPQITVANASNAEASSIQMTINLSFAAIADVEIPYRIIAGTAQLGTADLEGVAQTGTVTIPAGDSSAQLNINTFDRFSRAEIDENFVVEFYDPANAEFSGGGTSIQATAVVLEGSSVALFVNDPVIVETDGTLNARFEILLSRAAGSNLQFDYTTVDASATAGTDYTATSGTLTITAGQTVAEILVPILGDTMPEPGEVFSLVLTPTLAASSVIANGVTDSTGIATIIDDDSASPLPELTATFADNIEAASTQMILRLSEPAIADVTIQYRLVPGTASLGSADLEGVAQRGSITIPAGSSSAQLNINTFDRFSRSEVDEIYTVEFYDPVNAVLGGGGNSFNVSAVILQGSGVSLFVGDPILVETDGATEALFEVRLSRPSADDLSFTYTTADASARAGSDYTETSGSLTFLAGQTVAQIAVPVIGDRISEQNEYFSLVVTPTFASSSAIVNGVADAEGIALIIDDDTSDVLPELSVRDADSTEAASIQMVLDLTQPAIADVTVAYRIIADTAQLGTADLENVSQSGTVTIPAGSSSAQLNINTFDRFGRAEIDEHFVVEFYDPVNAVLSGGVDTISATAVVREGSGVALFVGDPVFVETDGATEARFDIHLSRPTDQDVTFNYTTVDGSATQGSDYSAVSGTLVIPAGQTITEIAVPIIGDVIPESAETFSLVLTPDLATTSAISNIFLDSTGIATILDDDTSAVLPELSARYATNVESASIQMIFQLSEPAIGDVSVSYRILSGTAVVGISTDMEGVAPSGTVTIPAGSISAQLNINTFDRFGVAEIDENFTVEIFDPVNAVLAGGETAARTTAVILEGAEVELFVGDPILVETNGRTEAQFEVFLSRPSATDLEYSYATADGSATAGSDYVETTGTLTFLAGQTQAFVNVPVLGDKVEEPSEVFSLVVTSTIPIADPQSDTGIATIQNDDINIFGNNQNNTLNGSSFDESFFGRGGLDVINAGGGNDCVQGGAGADTMNGGAGFDILSYAGATNGVFVYLNSGRGYQNDASGDRFQNFEAITGSDFNDRLLGDNGNNTLAGGGGDDIIKGRNGNNILDGGGGNDRVFGGEGNETHYGRSGDDLLFGLGGNDTLFGNNGADGLFGGRDNDQAYGGNGDDAVRGNRGDDQVFGNGGNDDVRGGGNNDLVDGGSGDDFLLGGKGLDRVVGGSGDDVLAGGNGGGVGDGVADTFVFSDAHGGFDRIRDFEDGLDLLDLSGYEFISFAADIAGNASARNGGADTRIDLGGSNFIYIDNLALADLGADDFIL